MRRNQTSWTAMGIAIVRAIESEKPEGERICYDPFARKFVNPILFHFVRFFDRLGYSEVKGPGVMGFLVARDRHIDEFLKRQLSQNIEQVVILGAGLDSRAYRIDALNKIKVFEVDHPASQATKVDRLRQVLGGLPPHVAYVPIDFNGETLSDRLPAFGYNPSLKTCFLWQGVTQYLTPQAVDETLLFITQHSAAGSSIIFDYMYPALLNGTIKRGEVENMRSKQWISGEVMSFGIPEGQIEDFLTKRGFIHIENADHTRFHDLYFTGVNAHRSAAYGYAIVSAFVP
jgi:methyltransferase (TIGR00027 family)